MQQDNTRDSALLTYYEESKVKIMLNNNDKNILIIYWKYAKNMLIFIAVVELRKENQAKKTKHGLNIYIFLYFGINRKRSLTLQKRTVKTF